MKKNIMTILLAMLSVVTWAQQEKGTWALQIKAGLNISGYTSYNFGAHDNQDEKADPRFAAHFGLEAEHQLTNRFGLVVGAHYSMQGDKESAPPGYWKYRDGVKNKIDYINIPILAKYYLLRGFSLKMGVQPAFNVRHVYDYGETRDLNDIGINIKNFDLAIPVGFSYEFDNHDNAGLAIETRWNYGLLKVIDVNKGRAPRNMVFQLSVGYRFLL